MTSRVNERTSAMVIEGPPGTTRTVGGGTSARDFPGRGGSHEHSQGLDRLASPSIEGRSLGDRQRNPARRPAGPPMGEADSASSGIRSTALPTRSSELDPP